MSGNIIKALIIFYIDDRWWCMMFDEDEVGENGVSGMLVHADCGGGDDNDESSWMMLVFVVVIRMMMMKALNNSTNLVQ